jgi:peptide/nickel transport system permease protein
VPDSSPVDPGAQLRERFLETGAEAEGLTVDGAAIGAGVEGRTARKRLPVAAWVAITWMVFIIGAAALAPWLPVLKDPNAIQQGGGLRLGSPSLDAWLGGDANSRDVFARLIWGARASLTIGIGSIVFAFVVGGTLGVIAGFVKGRLGEAIAGLLDIMLAFPALLLALYFVTILGRENWKIALALGIVATPAIARIARASTIAWADRDFVLAARAQGAKAPRIVVREILPNVLPAMYSIALLAMAITIVAEAALAQLGVGVIPPTASWGNIIFQARSHLDAAPWLMLAPAVAIFFTVLSLNYLGDVIRARFDVRESAL